MPLLAAAPAAGVVNIVGACVVEAMGVLVWPAGARPSQTGAVAGLAGVVEVLPLAVSGGRKGVPVPSRPDGWSRGVGKPPETVEQDAPRGHCTHTHVQTHTHARA